MTAISVQQSGGDYTTLEAAVEAAGTVDGDVITISGTWSARENTQIALADALTIQASGDSKQVGRPWRTGDTHYQHRNASGHSFTITDTGSITFDGVDIQSASTGSSDEIFRNNVSNTFLAKNCILGFDSRNYQQDIFYSEAVITATFESCHFYNAERAVVDAYTYNNGSVVNINSCTGYNLGSSATTSTRSGLVGVYGSGTNTITVNVFNTIAHCNTGLPITVAPSWTAYATINVHALITNATSISNDTLDTDTNNVTSATITDSTASAAYILNDVTTSPYDLRLADHANNTAQDNHANSTGAGLTIPSTDMMGTSRPQNTNYDIGAYEIAAGGGATTHEAALTLGKSLGYASAGDSVLEAALSFAQSVGMSTIADVSIEAALTLGKQVGQSVVSDAVYEASLNFDKDLQQTVSSIADLQSALTLALAVSQSQVSGSDIEAALTFDVALSQSQSVGRVLEGGVSFDANKGLGFQPQADLQAAVQFTQSLGIQLVKEAVLDAGLSLGNIRSITFNGVNTTTAVVLVGKRTMTISIQTLGMDVAGKNTSMVVTDPKLTMTIQ